MSDFKHHVTLTHREKPYSGESDQGRDVSYHLIGTSEQIGAEVQRWVSSALQRGSGPITITPMHPVNVIDLDKRT